MSSEPIRVLHVIGAMDRGGAETLVMNLYRNIDRKRIQFDFLVNETRKCDYDDEIVTLGGRIYRIPRFKLFNTPSYVRACRTFFTVDDHPIVHGHIGFPSAIYLREARQHGAFTIAHSHAQNFPLSPSELVFRVTSYPVRFVADYYIACSEQAGLDRFGPGIVSGDRYHMLKNGVDIDTVRYDVKKRQQIRSELQLSPDAPVFGHVGRLTPIKNHVFLFKIFSKIKEAVPEARLILTGRGEIEQELRTQVHNLGLDDSVFFLGVRDDVAAILSSLDVFIFPSFKEGLPVSVIEAQASGLPCLLSTGVPELASIRDQTQFLDLNSSANTWAEAAIKAYRTPNLSRADAWMDARKAGFDIMDSAAWLEDLYERAASKQPASFYS